MTRGAEIYVRIITFLVGLVLTALGIVCILWYAGVDPLASWLNDSWPKSQLNDADNTSWWFTTLVVTALIIILLCLNSIVQLSKRRTVDTLIIDGDQPGGAIHIELSDVGRAIARDLETKPIIRTASAHAVRDHGVDTLDIDVQAPADVPLTTLIKTAEQVSADVPVAVAYCGPTRRIFLRLDKVRRPDGTTSSARYRGVQKFPTPISKKTAMLSPSKTTAAPQERGKKPSFPTVYSTPCL